MERVMKPGAEEGLAILMEHVREVQAERREMLAALEALVDGWDSCVYTDRLPKPVWHDLYARVQAARTIIATARGKS
jgi:hypothetical protein